MYLNPLHALITLRKLVDHPAMVADVLQDIGLNELIGDLKVSNNFIFNDYVIFRKLSLPVR